MKRIDPDFCYLCLEVIPEGTKHRPSKHQRMPSREAIEKALESLSTSEQRMQDDYCRAHKLPIEKQRNKGIDYFHSSVGWIEFTTKGTVDEKDLSTYPNQAKPYRYIIVFADGIAPSSDLVNLLNRLSIPFEIFKS